MFRGFEQARLTEVYELFRHTLPVRGNGKRCSFDWVGGVFGDQKTAIVRCFSSNRKGGILAMATSARAKSDFLFAKVPVVNQCHMMQ